jgi:hypothetical protein
LTGTSDAGKVSDHAMELDRESEGWVLDAAHVCIAQIEGQPPTHHSLISI